MNSPTTDDQFHHRTQKHVMRTQTEVVAKSFEALHRKHLYFVQCPFHLQVKSIRMIHIPKSLSIRLNTTQEGQRKLELKKPFGLKN